MVADPLPLPRSVAHLHLLAAAHTLLHGRSGRIRVCDAGCGDGKLLEALAGCLPRLMPDATFEFYGYDVTDHGVQGEPEYLRKAIAHLEACQPGFAWSDRVHAIGERDPWPFADAQFDLVISNQVLEHVRDHPAFYREMTRTMAPDAWALHLFPSRHIFWEGHLNLPLIHRIGNWDLLERTIRFWSRLGLGKFRDHRRRTGVSLGRFAERHADYMLHFTNYLSGRDVMALGKAHGLRTSFRYVDGLYSQKVRRVLRRGPKLRYKPRPWPHGEWTKYLLLRHLSSITVVHQKRQAYAEPSDSSARPD